MELIFCLVIILLFVGLTYVLTKSKDWVFAIMIMVAWLGSTIYIAVSNNIDVDPTVTEIKIENIQLIEGGYVIEYNGIKKFLNKDEVKVEISDKNVLIENKYEYSKVENQFPYNITITNSDEIEYELLIKSEK